MYACNGDLTKTPLRCLLELFLYSCLMKMLLDGLVLTLIALLFVYIIRGYHRKKTGLD
ncbi:MAG: hypothetical protein LBN32_03695 [Helicobacteraceae bacterium]|nr:hypothetical protein [Helicobacteraceae bacterium]